MPGVLQRVWIKGHDSMEPAFGYQGLHLQTEIKGESPIDNLNTDKDPAQFVIEADHFSDCVLNDKEPKTDGEEGLRDMQLMAKIFNRRDSKMG